MLLRDNGVEVIAEDGEDHVPEACADGGVEKEMTVVHLRQSCRDRDKVSDAGYEPPRDGGKLAVVVEVSLASLHFLLIKETEMAEPTVGETVDDGSSEIVTCKVVDGRANIRTEGGEKDDEEGVKVTARSMVGSRRHDELRRHGDDRALKKHEDEHREVIQVVEQR